MVFEQYTVVTSDDLGKFEDRVNQLLGEGWVLKGGVAVCPTTPASDSTHAPDSCVRLQWSQAMALPSRHVPSALQEEAMPLPHAAEDWRKGEPPLSEL
ncbi:DUF1737 domain-containing protein [Luteolibacter flavescens]|uniref:DUF1737 domain-containing protein n=1 Tax=Luteolibacter flavescens TaxID=1859460 RepID=UPI003CCD5ECE